MVEEIERPLSENEAAELVERCFPTQSLEKQQTLHWSWDRILLHLLSLSDGEPKPLTYIYTAIGKDGRKWGINPRLFDIEPRWGGRYRYCHTVRANMNSLKKLGLVDPGTSRGMYRITNKGRERLAKLEQ